MHTNDELRPFPRGLIRAQRAANRGLEALGRRPREVVAPTYTSRDFRAVDEAERRRYDEARRRTSLDMTQCGRELIARGRELEAQAEAAKRAGVEVLRHSSERGTDAATWTELGELLGMTRAGAHKRFRDVEAPEAELTLDDALGA